MEEVSFEEQSEKHVPDAATERTRRRSAGAYAAECAFEYFTSLLVTDAFLTKVLKTIGTSDAACGIILSLASLAFVFQLCALLVISRIRNTKRFACTVHTVAQFLFSFLYLVPFLPFADGMRRSVFVVCMLLAYLGNHIVSSVIFKWGMSYVRNDRRARFTALKEAISLAAGIAVSLTVGIVTDSFDNSDNTAGFLIFTAVCMAIFALCDFICLMMIKAEQKKEKTAVIPLASALREVMSSRGFLRATVIQCLYYVALYSTIGFMGSYKQQELSYTLTQIQLINIAGIAARIVLSRFFGYFSDRKGYLAGLTAGFVTLAAAFLVNIFSSPETRFMVVFFTLLQNVSIAGINGNMQNIVYSVVPEQCFVHAQVIKNSIAGIAGFLASLISGKILSVIQGGGNTFFGMRVYGQQIFSAFSFAVTTATVAYMTCVIKNPSVRDGK